MTTVRLQFKKIGLAIIAVVTWIRGLYLPPKQKRLFSCVPERRREANILWHPAYGDPPPWELPGSHRELGEAAGRAWLRAVQHCWPALRYCPPGPSRPAAEHLGHDRCSSCLWHKPREEHPFPTVSGQRLRWELRTLLFSDYLKKTSNGLYRSCLWLKQKKKCSRMISSDAIVSFWCFSLYLYH